MLESAVHRPHPEDPAEARLRPATASGAWAGLHAQRFEIVSRGDFVHGILYSPDPIPNEPAPLLLLLHGTGEGMGSHALECAAPWVDRGLVVATLDLPLHGARSSPKLSERLVRGVERIARGAELDRETHVLVEEFSRQATSDLIRTLDALSALPGIDAARIGFMGFGVGAVVGSYLLGHDRRPRAAVLARVGASDGPAELDPNNYLAATRELSLLVVAAEDDESVPVRAARALFDAAPEPKEWLGYAGESRVLPDATRDTIWRFLGKELGL